MATTDDVYKLLNYRLTKSGFNGTVSPNDFNLIFPQAEFRYFSMKYESYDKNQKNEDSLIPFKSDPTTITIDGAGKYTKPADLLHIDTIRSSDNSNIDRVTDEKLGDNLQSTYDAPNVEFPIYTEYSTYLQFYPITLGAAKLIYLRKFTPSKWAYTLVSGRPVYDAANSVQPRWNDTDINAIIYMIGVDAGLNMRDQMEIQVNDVKAKENV